MIDDIVAGLLGEVAFGRLRRSRKFQLLARLFFGLLGGLLSGIGVVYFALRRDLTGNSALHASILAMFVFLGCFCVCNVGLARRWRWPGRLFLLSFVALFAARVLFGR